MTPGAPFAAGRGSQKSLTGRYAAAAALLGVVGMGLAWMVEERLGPPISRGILLGAGLATAGAVAGILLTAWGFERGQRRFLAALMLGILGRLVIYGATLVYVALWTTIDLMATVGALLAFYVLHQVLEIRFALRGLRREPR